MNATQPDILAICTALDLWWARYGAAWTAVRTLVEHGGWSHEDVLGEIRVTIIARQAMPSRFDARRSRLAAYVGIVARSRVLQLLRRMKRRPALLLTYDDQRQADEPAEELPDPEDAIGLEIDRPGRRRRGGRRPPALARRRPRTRRSTERPTRAPLV